METADKTRGRLLRTQGSRHQQRWRYPAERAAVESGGVLTQRRRNRSRYRGVRRSVMTRWSLLAPLLTTAAIAGLNLGAATAAPVSYSLPDETAAFKPGPNLEVVQNNCTACHS